ncbi:hypothetical protein [Dactylosporangium sp. NPDC051484]|uniref:hypothetical protein n=1 Tax=Dactylosporangium sp. NPDC051484 TaxID=3154942 RepID=UPI00344DA60E
MNVLLFVHFHSVIMKTMMAARRRSAARSAGGHLSGPVGTRAGSEPVPELGELEPEMR